MCSAKKINADRTVTLGRRKEVFQANNKEEVDVNRLPKYEDEVRVKGEK